MSAVSKTNTHNPLWTETSVDHYPKPTQLSVHLRSSDTMETKMEVVLYKWKPKNTLSRSIHGTRNKRYLCVHELQGLLRIKRINIRGKETTNLRVNGRKRNFIHTKHLELILGRKPASNQIATWLRREFLGVDPIATVPAPPAVPPSSSTAVPHTAPQQKMFHVVGVDDQDEVKDLLDNHFSRIPYPVRMWLINKYGLNQWHQDRITNERLLRAQDARRRRGDDEKVEELPDEREPNLWVKGPYRIRYFNHEAITWIHVNDWCGPMKFSPSHCTPLAKPPDVLQPWTLKHRDHIYVNATVLHWHRLSIPEYESDRKATWDNFY